MHDLAPIAARNVERLVLHDDTIDPPIAPSNGSVVSVGDASSSRN